MEVDGTFMEERLVMPLDVYEEFRVQGPPAHGNQIDDNHYQLNQVFVQIDTDEGVSGISGPTMPGGTAFHVWEMRNFLIGRDPLATEFLWDIMHRKSVHGRQGKPMMAISLIDNALWDLKGKWFKTPVWKLIGGGGRGSMPAYASMLSYATQDLGLVKERALEMQKRGYKAQKWFFRHGPMSGAEGFKKNVAMVETLRDTLGDDDDIMLDCWQSMDVNYVVKLAEAIEDTHPRWLEEVAMPDRIDSYRKIRESTNIPISGAEHEYTRWGFKRFIDEEAVDIIQPDLNWAGGLSEVLKIGALATTYDLITICHQGVTPAGMAWSSTQSPIHTPYVEMLVKYAAMSYYFDANGGPNYADGELSVSESPGFGFDIDESKIESQTDIEY
jgi:L-alanine-DL-glutamate epimerase-like enolase superfamily enzyme